MLLTKRSAGGGGSSPSALVGSLARGVSRAIPTMDRRAFLRRSGMGVGAGLAASQLTLVRKAEAASRTLPACAARANAASRVWVSMRRAFNRPRGGAPPR